MVTINKTALLSAAQKAISLWQQSAPMRAALLATLCGWLKNRNMQLTALRHISFVLAGYLLTMLLVYLYSLSLQTAKPLPAPLAQQLQQQDVTLAEINEAVTRLEKKKALAKL